MSSSTTARPPYRPPELKTLTWVLEQCGASRVVRIERLVGGITSDVDRLVLERATGGGSEQVVLRRWTTPENELATDGPVEREAAALTALTSPGASAVPAPRLLAADPTGSRAGVRCLLMSVVPGAVDLAPRDVHAWARELARALATVHALPATLTARSAGWFDPGADRSWIGDPGLARAALEATVTSDDADDADDVFVHGDFQPFNVLWRTGPTRARQPVSEPTVSGVVDWPNAGTGPRGIDVGHCRLNLAVLASPDVAAEFVGRYEDVTGVRVHPGAQLRALLSWDPGWQRFIPEQVAGRATVDIAGMAQRVVDTIRRTVP